MSGINLSYILGGVNVGVAYQSAIVAANNQASALRAQAQADEYNATVEAQKASAARAAAGAKEDAFRDSQRQFLAKQRAAAAESGFDSATGSTSLLLQQDADRSEVDALMIRHQGLLESMGYDSQAVLDHYNAQVRNNNADRARRAGYWNAATAALSTATSYVSGGLKLA